MNWAFIVQCLAAGFVGGMLSAAVRHGVRRWREARAERRRLELFAAVVNVAPLPRESNKSLRARIEGAMRGVEDRCEEAAKDPKWTHPWFRSKGGRA
jgi:hypothetical protein